MLAIAFGGAIGAVFRYLLSSTIVSTFGRDFPYATLAVNIIGSLVIGFLYVLLLERGHLNATWTAGLTVGVLGAFTTFSTFSLETLGLIEQGKVLAASTYAGASLLLCLLATWAGLSLARTI